MGGTGVEERCLAVVGFPEVHALIHRILRCFAHLRVCIVRIHDGGCSSVWLDRD
jgi:hypothetical protein